MTTRPTNRQPDSWRQSARVALGCWMTILSFIAAAVCLYAIYFLVTH